MFPNLVLVLVSWTFLCASGRGELPRDARERFRELYPTIKEMMEAGFAYSSDVERSSVDNGYIVTDDVSNFPVVMASSVNEKAEEMTAERVMEGAMLNFIEQMNVQQTTTTTETTSSSTTRTSSSSSDAGTTQLLLTELSLLREAVRTLRIPAAKVSLDCPAIQEELCPLLRETTTTTTTTTTTEPPLVVVEELLEASAAQMELMTLIGSIATGLFGAAVSAWIVRCIYLCRTRKMEPERPREPEARREPERSPQREPLHLLRTPPPPPPARQHPLDDSGFEMSQMNHVATPRILGPRFTLSPGTAADNIRI